MSEELAAEVHKVYCSDGRWYRPEGEDWGDDVKGYVPPDEVLRYMNMIAAKP